MSPFRLGGVIAVRSKWRKWVQKQTLGCCKLTRNDDRAAVAEVRHAGPFQELSWRDPVIPAGDTAAQRPLGFSDDLDLLELDGYCEALQSVLPSEGGAECPEATERLRGRGETADGLARVRSAPAGRGPVGAIAGSGQHMLAAASQPSTPARVERTR